MDLQCEFCSRNFKNKSSLNLHQKTTKYCLELQKKENNFEDAPSIEGNYECEFCNKKFNLKNHLQTHYKTCKHRILKILEKEKMDITKQVETELQFLKFKNEILEKENNELKNKIKLLETENRRINEDYLKVLKDLSCDYREKIKLLENGNKRINEDYLQTLKDASCDFKENIKTIEKVSIKAIENAGHKMTVNNNSKNYIQNLVPLTDQYIKEQSKNLQLKHVRGKAESLAYFANEYSLKDRVICTDVARRNFIFKDENGNVVKDPKGVKITKRFIENNKNELSRLLSQYALLYYEDNCPYEYKDKVEIDECLYAIQRGDVPSNAENYTKFERQFTSCFSKLVYNKNIQDELEETKFLEESKSSEETKTIDISEEGFEETKQTNATKEEMKSHQGQVYNEENEEKHRGYSIGEEMYTEEELDMFINPFKKDHLYSRKDLFSSKK